MTGLTVLIAALVVAGLAAWVIQFVNGRFRARAGTDVLTVADLGAPLGERATLVHFSSAFCQPCRATRRILCEVSEMVPGVSHVEIDAEERLALVRELQILRTPAVLVLDASGSEVRRAYGQPRKADVVAALGAAVGGASTGGDGEEAERGQA
jgi:thiol-disulfide isomerase/thioredoxin